jgi:hypothetical protein
MMVYFVQAADGPVKIGISKNPPARMVKMQADNHSPLTLLAVTPGGVAEEQAFHLRFAASRLHGEWFSPAPELLALVRSFGQCPVVTLTDLQRDLLRAVACGQWEGWLPPSGRSMFIATAKRLRRRGLIENRNSAWHLTERGQALMAEAAR